MAMSAIEYLKLCIANHELLIRMVQSRLISEQKDLFLGYLWWFLEPIFLTLIYWLLIGVIFQRGGDDYPLFILCGMIPFRAYAMSVNQSVNSIASQFSLISQVNFPRIFLPIRFVLLNHVRLIFGLMIMVMVAGLMGKGLGLHLILLLIPFSLQILFASGIAIVLSILGVYFPDLKNMMQFITRMVLFFTPVLYSIDRIPLNFRDIFMLNPLATIIIGYRDIIFYGYFSHVSYLIGLMFASILILFMGLIFFIRHDKEVLKII